MRVGTAVFIFIIIVAVIVHLVGCAPATPFTTGAEVSPPAGCIEYRTRGGEC